jgi:hypothetical protein
MSWANIELRKRLLEAVSDAKAPLFLIQAQNDYGLGPSEVLGPVIKRKGSPNQAKVYSPYGLPLRRGTMTLQQKKAASPSGDRMFSPSSRR